MLNVNFPTVSLFGLKNKSNTHDSPILKYSISSVRHRIELVLLLFDYHPIVIIVELEQNQYMVPYLLIIKAWFCCSLLIFHIEDILNDD